MKKQKNFFIAFLFALSFIMGNSFLFAQESITFTSYYPAPFGSYDRLRFVPRTAMGACTVALLGTVYYDSSVTPYQLKVCTDVGTGPIWAVIGGGTNVWTQSGNSIFPTDTAINPFLNVGIGTQTPGAALEISYVEPVIRMTNEGKIWGGPVGSQAGGFIEFRDSTTRGGWLGYGGGYDENLYLTNERPNKGIRFNTFEPPNTTVTRMAIDVLGNVGISTITPNAKLDVHPNNAWGAFGTNEAMRITSPDTDYMMGIEPYVVAAGNVGYAFRPGFQNTLNNALVIDTVGNVGINNTTPAQALDVNGSVLVSGQGSFGGNLYSAGAVVWTGNNDGSGSGLDADRVEGKDLIYSEVPATPQYARMCFTSSASCTLASTTCSGFASLNRSPCKYNDSICTSLCRATYPNPCSLRTCNGDVSGSCVGGTTNCASGTVQGTAAECIGVTEVCDCFLSNSTYLLEIPASGLPAGTYCSTFSNISAGNDNYGVVRVRATGQTALGNNDAWCGWDRDDACAQICVINNMGTGGNYSWASPGGACGQFHCDCFVAVIK